MGRKAWFMVAALAFVSHAAAGDFGSPGGPTPANIDEIWPNLANWLRPPSITDCREISPVGAPRWRQLLVRGCPVAQVPDGNQS